MSPLKVRSPIDDLPRQFVAAMKTLFDIMDDKHTGYIKFTEIQTRWEEDDIKGLPKGVIESLRKVTPSSGLLSFERFCAGLKICLLRNKSEESSKNEVQTPNIYHPSNSPLNQRPQSVPADRLMRDKTITVNPLTVRQNSVANIQETYTPSPRSGTAMVKSRTISMPQLGEKKLIEKSEPQGRIAPPHKIIRSKSNVNMNQRLSHSDIMMTLQNWHLSFKANSEAKQKVTPVRPPADGKAIGCDYYGGTVSEGEVTTHQESSGKVISTNRRRDPRRHTLTSGVDYNMLKRMKQLEQEKDVLLQGLEAVDKAHDWYLRQINSVQDKMKSIGKSTAPVEYSTEAHQEKLNFQMARIFEVNQHLSALVESSERGFPLHMNLAVQPLPYQMRRSQDDATVRRLREQNHLLTEEVSQKSERITQLEREKTSLIRELFQARAQCRKNIDDTTFL